MRLGGTLNIRSTPAPLKATDCNLTAPDAFVISSLAVTSKWMPPYITAQLITKHYFFDSHYFEQQIIIIQEVIMLSFAEEIYLLSLDDITGKLIVPSKEIILNSVLVGAVLCELSFLNKVDSDLEDLHILNTEPTNNPILDSTLESLKKLDTTKIPISRCLNILLQNAKDIENQVLDQLIENSIVKKMEGRILWVIPTRRYPKIDDCQIKDVETRLRELILSDNIPEPRETVLVSLVHTCGLFRQILSPRELRRSEDRIKTISKVDIVGRKVVQLIDDINIARSHQFII